MRTATVTNRGNRGFTLMECMIALGLLLVSGLATAQLVTVLGSSSQKVDATTEAVALANVLTAEINDAKFFSVTNLDPGLAVGPHATAVTGSTITSVGSYPSVRPIFLATYEVLTCTACNDPFGDGQVALGGVDIVVTIDNDPSRARGDWRLRGPLHFFTRKEFAPSSTDPTLIRGW